MMSIFLEAAQNQEMDEELGYFKYDYRNKGTDNFRNGHSQKTMHTSYGDREINIPRDRKGELEPQYVKKYQNTVTQDMEEKIISMYATGMTTNGAISREERLECGQLFGFLIRLLKNMTQTSHLNKCLCTLKIQ